MYARMKLKDAIQMIEEREKMMRQAHKEMKKEDFFNLGSDSFGKEKGALERKNGMRENLVHVQSIFPRADVIALKEKAGGTTIRNAISKAVSHYLNCK